VQQRYISVKQNKTCTCTIINVPVNLQHLN